jgi:hypothetical protein
MTSGQMGGDGAGSPSLRGCRLARGSLTEGTKIPALPFLAGIPPSAQANAGAISLSLPGHPMVLMSWTLTSMRLAPVTGHTAEHERQDLLAVTSPRC